MKNILLTCFISCTLTACGQNKKSNPAEPEVFNSKYVRLVPDTNRMMLIENVVIRYGELKAEADSALLDKNFQTITLFGARKIYFKGDAVADTRSLRYVKGENQFHTN